MNINLITLLLVVIIIGYGLFVMFTNIKRYVKCTKAKKEFLETTKEQIEVFSDALIWCVGCIVVTMLIAFALVYEIQNTKDELSIATYTFAILFLLSMISEFLIKRTILFSDTGFFYEETFHRFRNVRKIERAKGMFVRYEVQIASNKQIVPKKIGNLLMKHYEDYKKEKKKRK